MGKSHSHLEKEKDEKGTSHPNKTGSEGMVGEKVLQKTYENIAEDIITNNKYTQLWRINDEEKEILRSIWKVIVKDISSIGVVTFLKMFETHPETLSSFVKGVYSIKELEMNEWYQENLKTHAIRVMGIVEKVMHRLDEELRAAQILIGRGFWHNQRGVQRNMLEKMGKSFVLALQSKLEEDGSWNPSIEKAWLSMFRFIEFWMGICYIKPNELDVTLTKSIESSCQSQIPNDTKLDNGEINHTNNEAHAALPHVSSQDMLPPWLQGKSNEDHVKSK